MATKMRKQVYIEPYQEMILKRLAKDEGVTEAEIIRKAIDRHALALFFPRRDLVAWEAERAFIQRRIEQGPLPGKRMWRREELHER